MHLWDYWAVVMKRLYIVAPFVVLCVGAAWFWTRNREPVYQATASIELRPPATLGVDSFYAPIFADDSYLNTQVDKFSAQSTIRRAVVERQLDKDPAFEGRSVDEIVRLALGRVDVSVRRMRLILDVSVKGPEKRLLAPLANALAEDFRENQKSESRERRVAKRREIEMQLEAVKRSRDRAIADKSFVLETNNLSEFQIENENKWQQDRLETFTKERDLVAREIGRDAEMYKRLGDAKLRIDEARAAAPDATPDPAQPIVDELLQLQLVRENPSVRAEQALISSLDEQLVQLESADAGTGSIEWKRNDAARQIHVARRAQVVLNVVSGFLAEYEARVSDRKSLDEMVDEITGKVEKLARIKLQVDQKNSEIDRCNHDEETYQRQLEPLLEREYTEPDFVRIMDLAKEPTTPIAPNHTSDVALGAIAGVLGGVALAFLLDYLDDTIRTKDELAKVADVPLLGIVPNIEGRGADPTRRDLFAHHQPKSTISEAYRGVRTALTLSADAPHHKVLLLTSAGPREGKTTTAINLSTVLAYSGGRTLLVDADLRKPRIHKSFGVPNVRGLTNLIVGQDDPLEACLETELDNVDVLPSGPIPPNPSELLGHPRMREILARLRERYDHIILDTPPIGAVTDAAVLATVVDGVILVVHAGKTRRQIVMRGLEQLRYINAKIVGVILNNLRLSRVHYYPGYYHYYYYYSSHYGEEEGAPERGKRPADGRRTGTPSS